MFQTFGASRKRAGWSERPGRSRAVGAGMAVVGGEAEAAHDSGQVGHALLEADLESLHVGAAGVDGLGNKNVGSRGMSKL